MRIRSTARYIRKDATMEIFCLSLHLIYSEYTDTGTSGFNITACVHMERIRLLANGAIY